MPNIPNPVMPFGKFKYDNISDINVEYLDWLIGQDWLEDPLKSDIEEHLKHRPEWERME